MKHFVSIKKISVIKRTVFHPKYGYHPYDGKLMTATDYEYVRAGVKYRMRFMNGGWGYYQFINGVLSEDINNWSRIDERVLCSMKYHAMNMRHG